MPLIYFKWLTELSSQFFVFFCFSDADSCARDSGGPLMIQEDEGSKMYMAGITSFGKRKCGTGFPGVYTDITYYIDWIKDNLRP